MLNVVINGEKTENCQGSGGVPIACVEYLFIFLFPFVYSIWFLQGCFEFYFFGVVSRYNYIYAYCHLLSLIMCSQRYLKCPYESQSDPMQDSGKSKNPKL